VVEQDDSKDAIVGQWTPCVRRTVQGERISLHERRRIRARTDQDDPPTHHDAEVDRRTVVKSCLLPDVVPGGGRTERDETEENAARLRVVMPLASRDGLTTVVDLSKIEDVGAGCRHGGDTEALDDAVLIE
jgi:hypothetical protein